jgi:hypothetical protein
MLMVDDSKPLGSLRSSAFLDSWIWSDIHRDSFSLHPSFPKYMVTQVELCNTSFYFSLDYLGNSDPGLSMYPHQLFLESSTSQRPLHQAKYILCSWWSHYYASGNRVVLLTSSHYMESATFKNAETGPFGGVRYRRIVRNTYTPFTYFMLTFHFSVCIASILRVYHVTEIRSSDPTCESLFDMVK